MTENNKDETIKFKVVAPKEQNIGVETKNSIVNKIAKDEGLASQIDSSILSSFRDISTKRELQYKMYDEMSKDVVISSALDLYADDATEYAEDGKVIWASAQDTEVQKIVNYFLKILKLDENAWMHIHALVKYGDVYLQTFRTSDVDERVGVNKVIQNTTGKQSLKETKKESDKQPFLLEDVIVNYYDDSDQLEEYIEMISNPAELFDLVKKGKTSGFLKTKLPAESAQTNQSIISYNYNVRSNDVKLYDATKFIHISLPDTSNRNPETVQLFRNLGKDIPKVKDKEKYQQSLEYTVKRGKSILYDIYKIYRELKLLEDSILLGRLTKSSILRVVQVEVGEMGKAAVQQVLQRIKALMEQKTSMTENQDMGSYLSPGSVENNIYVPTRDGKGQLSTQTLGGDVNVGDLTDLDYFNNKLFAGLKIPKPFLGFMDDNAGFSGGESLTKVSSRYAKTIKRVQNAYIQGITTLINIFLLDRGMDTYVNAFEIKMQSPSTVEDNDKIEMLSTKVQLVSDILMMLSDIEDSTDRLKVAKILLNKYIGDDEITELLEEIISKQEGNIPDSDESSKDKVPTTSPSSLKSDNKETTNINNNNIETDDKETASSSKQNDNEEDALPNPKDLDIDLSDNEEVANQLKGEE